MDTTPLYSAEQIVVPEELAGVLKQYTKAVIRAQPTNILEFSARYFEELAQSKGRVSKNQLIKLRKSFEKAQHVDTDTIRDLSNKVQISKEVFGAITGRMSTNEWEEFITLSCTLLGQDFLSSMEVVFDVFAPDTDTQTPALHKEIVHKALSYIGKHDPSINSQFMQSIDQALSHEPEITYGEFLQLQAVKGLRK